MSGYFKPVGYYRPSVKYVCYVIDVVSGRVVDSMITDLNGVRKVRREYANNAGVRVAQERYYGSIW